MMKAGLQSPDTNFCTIFVAV